MAIKIKQSFVNQAQAIDTYAKLNKYYDKAAIDAMNAQDAEDMKKMLAASRDMSVDTFNNYKYRMLGPKEKLSYYYNEFYQDRNETTVNDDNKTVNVYEERKKYLDVAFEDAVARKTYNDMSFMEKVFTNVGGFLGNMAVEIYSLGEGIIDALLFSLEGVARSADLDEAGDRFRRVMLEDTTGARKARADMDRFTRNYTEYDNSAIYRAVYDVGGAIAKMAPMFIPGIGPVGSIAYYTAMAGDNAYNIISSNPDINYGKVFAYVAASTALEYATEKLSSKVFGKITAVDKAFGIKGSSKLLSSGMIKSTLYGLGLDFVSEGLEEMVSELFSGILYNVLIDPTAQPVSAENILYAALIGGLTGGVMSGGQIMTSGKYAVDTSGELRLVSDIREEAKAQGKKTKDLIGKKMSRMASFSLNQALESVSQIEALNVADLKQQTGMTEEQLKNDSKYAKKYEEARKKDDVLTLNKQKSALALVKYMNALGVNQFQDATEILETNLAKAKKLIDNYNVIRSGQMDKYAKYNRAFSLANKGALIAINPSPSDEFRALANEIKKEYGIEVLSGTVGSPTGLGASPITAVDGAILIDENLLSQQTASQLFDSVIKQQLVSAAITENSWLTNKEVGKILNEVLPDEVDTSNPITEDVKRAIVQELLFDDIAIENIFLRDKNVFVRFARWIQNKIKAIKNKSKTKSKKIEFNQLLKTRDKYINAVATNIGNDRDVEKATKVFDLSEAEIADKLVAVMKEDEFNRHVVLMDTDLSKDAVNRMRAVRYFKNQLKPNALDINGEIVWDAAKDPNNYTDSYRSKLAKKFPNTSFHDAVFYDMYYTYDMVISYKNNAIYKPVNLMNKMKTDFLNTLDNYINSGEGLDALTQYNNIESIFGKRLTKYFTQEQLDSINISYVKDYPVPGRIYISDNRIEIKIDASRPHSILPALVHEVSHAIANTQGLPEGVSLSVVREGVRNLSETKINTYAYQTLNRTFIETHNREQIIDALSKFLYNNTFGERYARGDVEGFISENGFDVSGKYLIGSGKYRGIILRMDSGFADLAVEKVDSTEDTKTITRTKADGTVITETVKKSTGKGDSKEKKNATPTAIRQSLESKYNKNAESMRKAGYSTEFINDFLDSSIDKPVTFYTDKIDDAVGKIATTNEDLRELQSGKVISIYDEKLKKRIFKSWSELTEEQQNAEKARISRQAGNNQIGSVDAINDLISICYPNNQNIKDITSILREITGASTGSGERVGMVFSEGSVMKTGASPLTLALTYSKLKSTILTGDFSWLESLYTPTTVKKGEELAKVLKREGHEDDEIKLIIERYETDVLEAKQNIKNLFEDYKNIFESENKDMKLTVPHMVSVLLGDVNFETKTYKLNKDKYNAVAPLLVYINTLLQDKQNPKTEVIKKLLSEDFARTYETSKKMFTALQKGLLYELSVGEGAVKGKKGKGETSFIERASSDEDVSFEESDTEDALAETEESVDYDEDGAFEALLKSEDLENRKKGLKKTSFGEDKMIEAISKNSQKVTEWLESPQKENVGIAKYFSNVLGFKAALNRKDVSEAVKEEIKTQASLDEFVRVIDEYIDNIDVSQPGAEDLFYKIYTKLDAQRNNIAVAFGKTAWDDVVKHHVPNQRKSGYNYTAKELLDKVHEKRKKDVREKSKETKTSSTDVASGEESVISDVVKFNREYLKQKQEEEIGVKEKRLAVLNKKLENFNSKTEQKKRFEKESVKLLEKKRQKSGLSTAEISEAEEKALIEDISEDILNERVALRKKIGNLEKEIASDKEKLIEQKPVEEKTQETNISENDTDSTGNKLTKEQQEFFKESKIRDKYGRLLKLYHGSPASDIISFEFSDDAPNNFFTTSKPYAEQYINDIDTGEPDGKVYEVYLNIKNPFNATDPKNAELAEKILGRVPTTRTVSDTDKIYKYLRENETEFDGIVAGEELSDKMIAEYGKNANTSFVPLYPEQIKLVENTDPKNSDSIYDFDEEQLFKDYLDERQQEKTEKKKQEIKSLKEELTTLDSKTEQKKRLEKKSKELLNKKKKLGFDGDSLGEFDKADLNKIVKSEIASEKASIEEKIKDIEEELAPDELTEVVKEEIKKEKITSVARTPEQERLIKGIADKYYRTNPDSILYEKNYSSVIGYTEEANKEYGVRSYENFVSTKEPVLAQITKEEDIELILDAIENDEIPFFEAAAFLDWLYLKRYIFNTNDRIVEKYNTLRQEIVGTSGAVLATQRWHLAPHEDVSRTISDVTQDIKAKFEFSQEFINKHLPELNNVEARISELTEEINALKQQIQNEKDAYEKYVKELDLKNKELELALTTSKNSIGLLEHKLKEKYNSDTDVVSTIEESAKIYEEVGKEIADFVEKHKQLTRGEKAYIKLDSWRYLSMLSNPATWGKNAITNTLVSAGEFVVDLCGKTIYKFATKKRAEYIKQVGYYGDYDKSFKELVHKLFKARLEDDLLGSKYEKKKVKKTQAAYARERAAKTKGPLLNKIEKFLYDKALSDKYWVVKRALKNAAGMLAGSRELLLQEVVTKLSAQYKVPEIDGKLDPDGLVEKMKQTNVSLAQRLESALSGNLNETILLSKEINPNGLIEQIIDKAGDRSNTLFFKADTALSEFINKTSTKHPAIGMVISSIIPFARSAINTGMFAITHSPIGVGMAVARWLKYRTNVSSDMMKEITEYYSDLYNETVAAEKKLDDKFKPETFEDWIKNEKTIDEETKAILLGDSKKIKQNANTIKKIYDKLYKEHKVRGNTIGITDLFGSSEATELAAKGIVGTAAMIVGLLLNAIFNVFDIDDDEDYLGPVLKIGNIKISLDSLSPASAMFSVGAILSSNRADKFADIFELMVNQTLLSSFEAGLKYNDSSLSWFQNQAINYVQQYIPGILKPLTKIIDNSKKDKTGNFILRLGKTTLSNLPGLSYIVGNKINPYTGENEKHFNSFIGSLLGAYSPITIRNKKRTEIEEDAIRYGAETIGLSGSFVYNGKTYKIKDSKQTEMAKYRANYINKEYSAISSDKKLITVEDENGKRITTKWSKLTDSQKQTVIRRIYSDSSTETKIKYWVSEGNIYRTNNINEYTKYRKLFGPNIQYKSNWSKSKFVER